MNAKQRRKHTRAFFRSIFGSVDPYEKPVPVRFSEAETMPFEKQMRIGWNICIRREGFPESLLVSE